jgi:N-acetylmuramoyl-L-alanine amidase
MKIAISSGHALKVRGASGYIDEVDEARKVVEKVADFYRQLGVGVETFHDNTSTTQGQNLDAIVAWHNSQTRDLDVAVHFNAFETTPDPMGTEVLYVTQEDLAGDVSRAMAEAGQFINRGAKYRGDLAFLNGTDKPAILLEVCFVDSKTDTELYDDYFDAICLAIAESTSGQTMGQEPGEPDQPPRPDRPADLYPIWKNEGRVSWFGGPDDEEGVAADEGLAFIFEYGTAPHLFLPQQPPGTTGLARRLDPSVFYIAQRWDYDVYPKDMLASQKYVAIVRAPKTGKVFPAWPADWGPHEEETGRAADISEGMLTALGIQTDDSVEVSFPHLAMSVAPIPPRPLPPFEPTEPLPPPPGGGWAFVPEWGFGWFPLVAPNWPPIRRKKTGKRKRKA